MVDVGYKGAIEDLKSDGLTGKMFYEYNIHKVVGYYVKNSKKRIYVVRCNVCKDSPDIYGEALFETSLNNLLDGQPSCGCARTTKWKEQEYTTRCVKESMSQGVEFKGWAEPFKGVLTKCLLSCNKHGDWKSCNISNFTVLHRSCPKCADEKRALAGSIANTKPDEFYIDSFRATGSYHPDSRFAKIQRKAKNSRNQYWEVYCPICCEYAECQQGHLLKGKTCCGCSFHNQTEAYINIVKDGGLEIALKFGISKDSKSRMETHNYNTSYHLDMFGIFKFTDTLNCKAAERECKQNLVCGIIGRELFSSGWTETTYTYNLDIIVSIFEKYGGVRVY
jgi:hypothetical protein